MIDIATEQLLSLNEARQMLPRRRGSKRPDISCLYRWTTVGCRGVVLGSVQVGGTRCTSVEALQRFCDALNTIAGPVARPTTLRRRSIERAKARLAANGF